MLLCIPLEPFTSDSIQTQRLWRITPKLMSDRVVCRKRSGSFLRLTFFFQRVAKSTLLETFSVNFYRFSRKHRKI